jgi:hypothetical protein
LTIKERCMSCGAAVPAETGACSYCGTHLDHGATNVPAPIPDRASAKIERFDRLAAHADFDKWMRHRPAASATSGATTTTGLVLITVGVLVAVFAAFMIDALGAAGVVAFIPAAAFVVQGVRVASAAPGLAGSPQDSSVKPYPALVVAKRMAVSTGQYGGSIYFVTLEFRTGSRREYDVDGTFFGLVAEDDIGVAYIREGSLRNFKQIDV